MKRFATTMLVGTAMVAALAFGHPAFAADATPVENSAFAMTLPAGFAAFTQQSQTVAAAEGKIETTNWISKAPTGEAVVVTVSKMPGKILDPDKLMDSTRDSLLKSLKATIENEEKIDGDVPARRLTFKSDAAFLRTRFVVSNDLFYQLLYVGRSEAQRAVPAVGEMFDTFRIIAPPAETVAVAAPTPAQ